MNRLKRTAQICKRNIFKKHRNEIDIPDEDKTLIVQNLGVKKPELAFHVLLPSAEGTSNGRSETA